MKLELVVIADQRAAVNTFSGLVQIKLRLPIIIPSNLLLSETSAKSEITSSDGNRGVKRVKVAVFSLKLKRLLEKTILRTNGEVLVFIF